MRQTGRNKGRLAVALCALGVLLTGCDADSDRSTTEAGGGTTSTSPGSSAAAAPPARAVVAVAYTRTSAGDPAAPPPEKVRAEVSLDGASFRMTTGDGSRDLAYDAAGGRAYEWNRSQDGAPESVALTSGLASGGPDHHGLTDGPHDPVAVFVRAPGVPVTRG